MNKKQFWKLSPGETTKIAFLINCTHCGKEMTTLSAITVDHPRVHENHGHPFAAHPSVRVCSDRCADLIRLTQAARDEQNLIKFSDDLEAHSLYGY